MNIATAKCRSLSSAEKNNYLKKMEENKAHCTPRLTKSTFKDILISANNDDVIIPVGSTFDKVVIHIGIGNRSGITIEKPPVKHGKKLITSVEHATRKFTESRELFAEPGEKFRRDMYKETNSDKHLFQLASSHYSKTPLETKNALETLSETGLPKQVQSGNTKVVDYKTKSDLPKITDESIVSRSKHEKETFAPPNVYCQSQPSQTINTGIVSDKLSKICVDALKATLPIREVCDTIDRAYENEMLAIAIDNKKAVFLQSKEFLRSDHTDKCMSLIDATYLNGFVEKSERDSYIFDVNELKTSDMEEQFSKTALQKQASRGNDTRTNLHEAVTSSKTQLTFPFERYIMIATENPPADIGLNDHSIISEIITVPTSDKTIDHKECIDNLPTRTQRYKKIKGVIIADDSITLQEEIEIFPGSVSERHDADESLESEIVETVIHIESSNSVHSDALRISVQIDQEQIVSKRSTFDDIESDDSIIDDDDEQLSDSDTLNDVLDIEIDDMVDIEAIVMQDPDEVVIAGEMNDFVDDTTNTNDMFVDDDDYNDIFGIMNIYIKSDLHFGLDKKPLADHSPEVKDFGYKFFSFATFFG